MHNAGFGNPEKIMHAFSFSMRPCPYLHMHSNNMFKKIILQGIAQMITSYIGYIPIFELLVYCLVKTKRFACIRKANGYTTKSPIRVTKTNQFNKGDALQKEKV